MHAMEAQGLSKTYPGGKEAVKSLALQLEEGEVFGFLGPNGAGKTTTVKLLTGVLTPSAGTCRVWEMDPVTEPHRVHRIAGIVTEHAQMYDHLTGKENLLFYAATFGLSSVEGSQRADALLRQLELHEAENQKLATYSTGMRQRLSLARALIHRPRILFLDEPTSGLDPESTQNVNHMIRHLARQQGVTVFLCTHQLRYAQEICTRYGLMKQGYLVAHGTWESLRSQAFSSTRLCIRATGIPAAWPLTPLGNGEFETTIRSSDEIPTWIRKIVEAGGDVYAVRTEEPSLEDIYFALTSTRQEETP